MALAGLNEFLTEAKQKNRLSEHFRRMLKEHGMWGGIVTPACSLMSSIYRACRYFCGRANGKVYLLMGVAGYTLSMLIQSHYFNECMKGID